jgi:cytochrome c biogenesis protein CcmG/thiol:disulfide interchange protein DsbE
MSSARPVLVVLGLGLLYALSLDAFPLARRTDPVLDALTALNALVEERTLPSVSVTAPSGEPVALTSLSEGRLRYVNIWGEFCPPCRAEMPTLDAFARAYAEDLDVIALSVDPMPATSVAFLRDLFPEGHALDLAYDPNGLAASQLGTDAYPETYVVMPDGQIVARLIGEQNFMSAQHIALANALIERVAGRSEAVAASP